MNPKNNSWMLWYFGNPGSSALEQIKQGLAHHVKKFGKSAELCLVHPAEFDAVANELGAKADELRDIKIDGVLLRPWRGSVVKHALIGFEEEPDYAVEIREAIERSRKEEAEPVREKVPA